MRGDVLSPTQCDSSSLHWSPPPHETGNLIWPPRWASTIFNRHSICSEISLRSFPPIVPCPYLLLLFYDQASCSSLDELCVMWSMPSWSWGLCVTLSLTIRLLSWILNCFSGTDLALIFLLSIPLNNTQWRPLRQHVPFLSSTGQTMKNKSKNPYLGQG